MRERIHNKARRACWSTNLGVNGITREGDLGHVRRKEWALFGTRQEMIED
jgi:hypothetical protein